MILVAWMKGCFAYAAKYLEKRERRFVDRSWRRAGRLNRRRLRYEDMEARLMFAVAADDSTDITVHDQVLSSSAIATSSLGEQVSFSELSPTSFGNLSLASDGTFQYTPNVWFIGTDRFTFRGSDSENFC